ncbi:unnamed protein product [Hermetia illucens]|uniref:Peptidase S1 domain-containing protein n=2 Tax=Hermetia illucens TaxID=343691 RepID=A0A7R8UBR3_HERIL|nr:unnamed protein product [Hermetia illucens]
MSSTIKWSNCLLAIGATLLLVAVSLPEARGLSSVDGRGARKLFGGYRITPKYCRPTKALPRSNPRFGGPTICMFNHECAQRNGEVVGACMDGFLFGACCQVHGEVGTNIVAEDETRRPEPTPVATHFQSYGGQLDHNEDSYQQVPVKGSLSNGFGGPMGGYYGSENELENEEASNGNVFVSNTNTILEDHKTNQYYVQNEQVVVSTPSTIPYVDKSPSYFPSSTMAPTTSDQVQYLPMNGSFSQEVPTLITAAHFAQTTPAPVQAYGEIQEITSDLIHSPLLGSDDYNSEFTHSDITHPSADTDLMEDDLQFSTGYGPSTVYVPAPSTEASTTTSTTESYRKPIGFKRKPSSTKPPEVVPTPDNKYVLVQTINKDKPEKKPQSPSMTTNDIESIESIILMLNDTNHGPSYNSEPSTPDPIKTSFSSSYGTQKPPMSTNGAMYDKYEPSHFITKKPGTIGMSTHIPMQGESSGYESMSMSTAKPASMIFTSTNPFAVLAQSTRPPKPESSSAYQGLVTASTTQTIAASSASTGSSTSTRKPTTWPLKTTKPPVTSYVTGPTTPRPRPSQSTYQSTTSTVHYAEKFDSTPSSGNLVHVSTFGPSVNYESVTQKIPQKPIFVKIPGTQKPSPTVIITPKPTVTVSTQTYTHQPSTIQSTTPMSTVKLPSTSYIFSPVVTTRPGLASSTTDYVNLPAPVISNDFDDPGYYGQTATTKPSYEFVTQSVYTIQPGAGTIFLGPTPSYKPLNVPTASVYNTNVESEIYTSPNDFVNFPPVRNPNLNMSATQSSVTSDLYLSTPAFVEDAVLKDKMNLLVNKIVASLQDNFDNLADLVEDRNATVFAAETIPTAPVRLATTRRPATTTKRTPVKGISGVTSKPPSKTTKKPAAGKPSSAGRPTTGRPSSGKPSSGKPSSGKPSSSKPSAVKPSAGRPSTTKKTVTTTKRTPVTRRPTTVVTTKKPIAQTISTLSASARPTKKPTTQPLNDAVEEEEETDETEEEDNEVDEDVIEETNAADQVSQGGRRLQCGVRPHVKSGRIVGGKGSTFGEWPWQVLVRESTWLGLFTKNKCGGVLITNKFVITAAHCQPGFLASLVAVFGEFDISGDLEEKRSVTKNVKRVIVHRQYDAATFENDLALLELESPIHYDTHIVPICMPSDTADFTGRMATVTGWGRLKYGGGVPTILQEVQVPIIENSVCQEMFHTAGHKKKILPSFLCAGYANGMKDSCEGDSGGPLVMQRSDGRWELAGTVSHGIQCAAPYLPGVYMRTTYYKPWLRSITGVK